MLCCEDLRSYTDEYLSRIIERNGQWVVESYEQLVAGKGQWLPISYCPFCGGEFK